MKGQIYKIHSDFYYAKTDLGIVECKLREILKKQQLSIFVGDYVKLEQFNKESMQAFISSIIKRKNYISRPKVANITKVIIVSSIKEPQLDFEQLNRYIALCEYHNLKPVLCFNKSDLSDEESLIENIQKIYSPLGYDIIFTCALKKIGFTPLLDILKANTTIFCGLSGVGKSSIINMISKIPSIKTKNVSNKAKKGVHTTRHCEIIEISDNIAVVDTPGFSNVKFNFLMPSEIQKLFIEIYKNSDKCKFNNCLHINESGCNIIKDINSYEPTRYQSYVKFVNEAQEYKEKITFSGNKEESKTKVNKNKVLTKISTKKRSSSRRTSKQAINDFY